MEKITEKEILDIIKNINDTLINIKDNGELLSYVNEKCQVITEMKNMAIEYHSDEIVSHINDELEYLEFHELICDIRKAVYEEGESVSINEIKSKLNIDEIKPDEMYIIPDESIEYFQNIVSFDGSEYIYDFAIMSQDGNTKLDSLYIDLKSKYVVFDIESKKKYKVMIL